MNNKIVLKQSVIAVALTLATSQFAMAQTVAAEPAVTRVIVTGSNIKRADKEGSSPVQVISAKDIKDSGAATVAELLKGVPAMGTNNSIDTNDGGFSRGVATASLRGLSSTSTLILLNGRRMTPAAYADPNDGNSTLYDLNSIPLSALERVEILKDGASAVYGSDAIGGVINFITKNNYQGGELSARYSANDKNLFVKKGVTGSFGKGDYDKDGYNVFVSVDLSQRDRVARKDATDIEDHLYRVLSGRYTTSYGSFVSQYPSFYRESAPGSKNFAVTQATRDARLIIGSGCPADQKLVGSTAMGLTAQSVFINRSFCNYDTDKYLEAVGAGKDASMMSRATFKLGADTKAFAEFAFTRTQRKYTAAPNTLGQSSTTNFTTAGVGTPFQAILEIGHPDNPFPNARASVGYRFANVEAGTETVNKNARGLVGVQGSLADWDWETALLWNESKKEDNTKGRFYLPTLRKLNTGTTLAQLAADPTIAHDSISQNSSSITQWDLKASREFGKLPGGPMAVAMGVEVRKEKLDLEPDPVQARGDILGFANTILHGSRNVKSAFMELQAPLIKGLELNAAGRIDKYDGLESNFVPKLGFKYKALDSLAFRGSFARGFRAPSLSQVTPGGAQFFESGLFDPKRCEVDEETPKPGASEVDCNKSAAGTGGANPDLKPEKSKSMTLGVIFSPTRDIDVVIDYFKIRKEGEVILGSAFDALRNEDKVPGNIVRDPNPLNWVTDAAGKPIPNTGPLLMVKEPWINQGMSQVSGFDFEVRHRLKLGDMGTLSSKLEATLLSNYVIVPNAGDAEHNIAGYNAGIADWNLSSGLSQPRWKSSLATSWTRDAHAVNAAINFVGAISQLRVWNGATTYAQPFCHYGARKSTDAEQNRSSTMPNYELFFPNCEIQSWTTFDLGYTYTGIKNVTLNINIKNLLDTAAPFDPANGVNTAGAALAGYRSSMHNNTGRYFSLRASYAF